MDMDELYERMRERYAQGDVPWDDPLPPPEVQELAGRLPPGRALDLGCGYGRAAIYLAARGWQVDGVDFVPQAIAVARERAQTAGVQVNFHVGRVTELDFLEGPYDLALDVGCGHAQDREGLRLYRDELLRLLRPGATFLVFARLREEEQVEGETRPRGVPETWLRETFAAGFNLQRVERGVTVMPDNSWESGWFWFVKIGPL